MRKTIALLSFCSACAMSPSLARDYAATASENFTLAQKEFQDKDYESSIEYADFVRIRFPFSALAVDAELLIARAYFEQGDYILATDAFRQFARMHPGHPHSKNGWAAYMVVVCNYLAAPDGLFILPPAHQLDQELLRVTLDELTYFFDHYPSSPLRPHAETIQRDVQQKLLDHELYVAKYYLDKDHPEAAIVRLNTAKTMYPTVGRTADILFLLALTYLRMDEVELSRQTFAELALQHPEHHHGKQARVYLEYIYNTFGPEDPNRGRPDRSPPTPTPLPRPKQA